MRKLLFLLLAALVSGAQAQSCCDARTANPPAFTWSAKPTCSASLTGRLIRISDVGPNDWIAVCDGTNSLWVPVSGYVLLGAIRAVTVTGTVADSVVGETVTVPAGLLGAGGSIEIKYLADGITNSANAKTANIRWGTTSGSGCTGNTSVNVGTNANITKLQSVTRLTNKDSVSSQATFINGAFTSPYGTAASAAATAAVDTSAVSYMCMTQAIPTAAETTTWEYIDVIAYPAP